MAHRHAEIIKAWADNPALIIQWRRDDMEWETIIGGLAAWDEANEYRIKQRTYPTTRMSEDEVFEIFHKAKDDARPALIRVVNAALSHAVDAGYAVDATTYDDDVRALAAKRNADRDTAIAWAVVAHMLALIPEYDAGVMDALRGADLAGIIAKVA